MLIEKSQSIVRVFLLGVMAIRKVSFVLAASLSLLFSILTPCRSLKQGETECRYGCIESIIFSGLLISFIKQINRETSFGLGVQVEGACGKRKLDTLGGKTASYLQTRAFDPSLQSPVVWGMIPLKVN